MRCDAMRCDVAWCRELKLPSSTQSPIFSSTTQYQEITDENQIIHAISHLIPIPSLSTSIHELVHPFIDLVTERDAYEMKWKRDDHNPSPSSSITTSPSPSITFHISLLKLRRCYMIPHPNKYMRWNKRLYM